MNILVLGAGAVGSYVGGHLAQREHNVTLVVRGYAASSIARHGLTITEAKNKRAFTVYPYAAPTLHAAMATGTSYDLIILGMKSYDLTASLNELSQQIDLHPPVLTLQNGIGVEDRVQRALMPSELIAGSLTTPVKRDETGGIRVEKSGRGLAIAPTRKGQSIRQWHELFNDTQLSTMKCDDAQSMKWSKALLNIVANATSAILDWHPRRIYEDDALFDLEVEMLRETLAVMKKLQFKVIDLPGSSARQLAAGVRYAPRSLLKPVLVKMVGSGRGDKMPSFHVDLYAGKRQSEVVYHNGAIARAGWQHGFSMPVNTALTEVLLTLVRSPELKSTYRDNPQKLLEVVANRRAMGTQ
jgi:2-dehydropantoate 2-reductase